ncbi:galactose-3-O-sulfotransferase 2-like [Branchiostoma lanceolatum]|uniref:galactose-3-O-sulfotransferase 2-like n=1 Tax=Branchiostoma lanceolatum TaxID=7740 RepID=UPI00345611BD
MSMNKSQLFLLLVLNSCVLIGYYIWHLNGTTHNLSGVRKQLASSARSVRQCQTTGELGYGRVSRWLASTNRQSQRPGETCTSPRTTFVFIKVHKAGGTTALSIMHRLAVVRNLSAVIPRMSVVLGHPFQLRLEDYHALNEGGKFDVLGEHSVYNRDVMDSIMKEDVVYLAVLRRPVSQLASTFHHYGIERKYRMKKSRGSVSNNPVENFLLNPWRRMPQPYRDGRNTPYSKYKNWQATEMGFPLGLSDNKVAIHDWVQSTGSEFFFVIILEHFDESMVMLRRLMCWEVKDIIYLRPSLSRSYKYKAKPPSEQALRNHRNFSAVDYALHEYWNASLWRRISRQGPDLHEEVAAYKQINSDAASYCEIASKESVPPKVFPPTKWSAQFEIDPLFCKLLNLFTVEIRRVLFYTMYAQGRLKNFKKESEKLNRYTITWQDIVQHSFQKIASKRAKKKHKG